MATTQTMSVGDFLLRRLREAGVDKIFGVPGDFNLELVQRVEDQDSVTWIGTCNELNASYAVKLIEQQNEYVNQLVSLFKSVTVKSEAPAADATKEV